MKPFVSLIVPCRNEEASISGVIESLIEQNYPAARTEILFIDGMSTDRTRAVIEQYRRNCSTPSIRILANPDVVTPAAFNVGIAAARGDVIFTLGAHSRYSRNYVSGVVATMQEMSADAVGSVAVTLPGADSVTARAIAAALAARFGVGNSLMRIGVDRPVEADTASCPGYRRAVFERVGRFNPRLVRNQDIEFNLRLRRAGGRIVIDPRITTFYRARPRLRDLFSNNFSNGYWVVRGLSVARLPFSPRHLVPLAFVASLLGTAAAAGFWAPALTGLALTAGCYLAADLWFSVKLAGSHGAKLLPPLLVTFPALHVSYGLGSLWALLTLGTATAFRPRKTVAVPARAAAVGPLRP